MVNPNIQIMSYQLSSIRTIPLTGIFQFSIVGFQGNGPSIVNQINFNDATRVSAVMPYDGFVHRFTVNVTGYPNQQQGVWAHGLIVNGIDAVRVEIFANPTQPFNPGPKKIRKDVFDTRPGFTDKPLFFEKGMVMSWYYGAKKGLFTVTRDDPISISLSVFIEFIRPDP